MKATGTFSQHVRAVADLEAENARLQEQVEEAEREIRSIEHSLEQSGQPVPYDGKSGPCRPDRVLWIAVSRETFRQQRDGWEALAKVRGEALEALLLYLDTVEEWNEDGEVWAGIEPPDRTISVKRVDVVDAIAMTPEEARP